MKIVHASDWHGHKRDTLPAANLYIITGDMLPNFPVGSAYGGRFISSQVEEQAQTVWINNQKSWRNCFGNIAAPLVVVRGNHDFTELAPLFGGEVYEITLDSSQTFEILGLKIGGMRGINWDNMGWSDEFKPEEMAELAENLPLDLDILVTHTPPYGILDMAHINLGAGVINSYLNRRRMSALEKGATDKPLLHCYGHIHECGAMIERIENVMFSNAACGYNIIEWPENL